MQYKRRKDGRFYTTVGTGQFDDNGKEIRIPIYDRDELTFLEKVAEKKYEVKHGLASYDHGFTFGSYAALWLTTYKPDNIMYANTVKNHLYNLRNIPLGKVVKTDIQECVNHNRGHYGLQHTQRILINQVFETALDDGLVKTNPCRKIIIDPKPKTNRRGLTDKEKEIIVNVKLEDMDKLFLMILLYTGMRRGEVLALQKTDFDLVKKQIHVTKSLSYKVSGAKPIITTPKTSSGVRTIDLLSHLEKYIKPYFLKHNHMYLFTDDEGHLLKGSELQSMWDRIMKALKKDGFKADITPHYFRHSFATDLYYSGVDIKKAVAILGHSDSQMMLEVYAHLDEQESKSLDKLENRFNLTKSD